MRTARNGQTKTATDPGCELTQPTVARVAKRVAVAAMATALLVGCTGGGSDQSGDGQPPAEQTGSTAASNQEETALGDEPDFPVNPVGDDGQSNPDGRLVFADDEGLSEDLAEAPVVTDDEDVEVDLEQTPDVPQADVSVSEAALCATVQIGRDAVADGEETLANQQRDLLVQRSSGVSDEKLSEILAQLSSDTALDRGVMESALGRCSELGFER